VSCEVDGPVDAIMHLASPASPIDYLRMPIETLRVGSVGTLNALELARAKGCRFVLASTSETYGDPLVHPQPESYWGNVNPVGPRGVYDEGKRFAEAACAAYRRSYGVDTAIARIFNTYGPRMRPHDGRAIPAFVVAALTGQPLRVHGDGSQTRAVCYVDDTVRGLVALLLADHGGPVNIGSANELTVLELARRVLAAVGGGSAIVRAERPVDDPSTRCPDISLAAEVLGWSPAIGLDEGLRRTIEWFRANI
jgi:dTDP-glucose 4,6-dehydratase